MRPIGFSTGALAKGDFRRGIELQRGVPAIELSALRDHELPLLIDALPQLDLSGFTYISLHAPSALRTLSEDSVFALLQRVPWRVIAHPELLQTPSLWRRLGDRLCLENMDDRKSTGRTVDELHALFALYPSASFCLDLGHARQLDPTMTSALLMLDAFGSRLRQIHISEVGSRGEHMPLGAMSRRAYAHVAHHIPMECPVIIESVVGEDGMASEMRAVREALG